MPLYEYECGRCGHRFEKIQKFSDPPLKTCPKCRGRVRKLVSAPAFQFKGSGWYVTDYGRKGPPGSQEKADKAGSEKERTSRDEREKGPKDERGKGSKEKKDAASPKKKNSSD